MAVTDYQSLMGPLLLELRDGGDRSLRELRDTLAQKFALTADDLSAMIPSGRVTTWSNRIGWALTYLVQAQVAERPRRAVFRITPCGRDLLRDSPKSIGNRELEQFPEFRESASGRPTSAERQMTRLGLACCPMSQPTSRHPRTASRQR